MTCWASPDAALRATHGQVAQYPQKLQCAPLSGQCKGLCEGPIKSRVVQNGLHNWPEFVWESSGHYGFAWIERKAAQIPKTNLFLWEHHASTHLKWRHPFASLHVMFAAWFVWTVKPRSSSEWSKDFAAAVIRRSRAIEHFLQKGWWERVCVRERTSAPWPLNIPERGTVRRRR